MTTALGEKIKSLIRMNGPLSVTDYFALCLADPEFGYYRTREPFGTAGDFITAPEISQLFGEMIGVFIVHAWQRHGLPAPVRLAEVGPGRGTMMSDMLRVIARLAPDLYRDSSVHLVETSERLRGIQRQTLEAHVEKIAWHDSFDEVPPGFVLVVANELFDAIPIRQFVKTGSRFLERMVSLGLDDELIFTTGVATLDPAQLPEGAAQQPDGAIFEFAPARRAVMTAMCERLKIEGGTALIIDYGHIATGFGDTLQALKAHDYDPPLASPGIADLTSHVDFEDLARTALAAGVTVNGCLRQGDFLFGLGLKDRAEALGRSKDEATQQEIVEAVQRLAGAGEGRMGELFKVLAVSSPAVALAPFRNV
ncbi:class I SAM-dependent methyltransferase [Allorhizobium sp. BGMRC 0089]|uniref:class I SAM-dependent methyltransferase n=1 Tax=Allorhizobium sonneratiae TaxID=2934936 RepID=UPI002033E593|nr:class I SAM-dependent methyltransferase [Allorhizobium sonneratiae]MCM2291233.1 class I SAM-dependent methyltransferase [Allorhizobium sonneratiae]